MKIIEKYKNIKENLSILWMTIKNDIKGIINNLKIVLKIASSDRVDLGMLIVAIVISVLDFVTNINLMGGLAFLTVFIISLLFRNAIWKFKHMTIEETNNNK